MRYTPTLFEETNLLMNSRKLRLGLALGLAFDLGTTDLLAATLVSSVDPKGQCSALTLSGEIRPGDHKQVAAAISEAKARAPLRRLYLDSPGGDVFSALAISNILQTLAPEIEAIVQPRSICNSACILILAAGSKQRVSAEASVVVHQAHNPKTGIPSLGISLGMAHFLVGRGMSTAIIETMKELKPGETLAISASNAKQSGLTTLRFFGSTEPPATRGCAWSGFAPKE